jgi:hypothetical protein
MDFSAGSLFASFLVSGVGFGLFLYGKKQARLPQLITGIAFMMYPYFVAGPEWILGIGAALGAGLWLALRAGL